MCLALNSSRSTWSFVRPGVSSIPVVLFLSTAEQVRAVRIMVSPTNKPTEKYFGVEWKTMIGHMDLEDGKQGKDNKKMIIHSTDHKRRAK